MNHLVIFPGMGSPLNEQYADVYACLDTIARKHYDSVHLLQWPGQDLSAQEELTLGGAVAHAGREISRLIPSGDSFTVLGRSFGCLVAVSEAIDLSRLQRLILWGPPPFAVLWALFKKDIALLKGKVRSKGTCIGEDLFSGLVPFESVIGGIVCPCVIATGTEDPYSPPEYLDFVRALHRTKTNFSYRVVQGAGHEVQTDASSSCLEAYENALFA